MGWPVDIECAYRGRDLYLLQCRPITALSAPCDPDSGARHEQLAHHTELRTMRCRHIRP